MIEFLIAVVPLLLLLGLLLFGRYPGHLAAMRLGERLSTRPKASVASDGTVRPPLLASHAIRGGLLIAFRLAQRPPPLAS